jgi:hypothetical protein
MGGYPEGRLRNRCAPGYFLSGFQPFQVRRLLRFNGRRETLQLRLSGEFRRLADGKGSMRMSYSQEILRGWWDELAFSEPLPRPRQKPPAASAQPRRGS